VRERHPKQLCFLLFSVFRLLFAILIRFLSRLSDITDAGRPSNSSPSPPHTATNLIQYISAKWHVERECVTQACYTSVRRMAIEAAASTLETLASIILPQMMFDLMLLNKDTQPRV
jgi:hypothetical protein